MNTLRETARPVETAGYPATDSALPTILRGEEVLDEAREVAQRISGWVSRALTERPPHPTGLPTDRN